MTRDRALETVEAILHELRVGDTPYLPPGEAIQVLEHVSAIRDEQKKVAA